MANPAKGEACFRLRRLAAYLDQGSRMKLTCWHTAPTAESQYDRYLLPDAITHLVMNGAECAAAASAGHVSGGARTTEPFVNTA